MLMKKIERKKIEEEKEKKTIIKRISIIYDIYKKQNQMETDETKKIKKRVLNKERLVKKNIIIEFFLHYFFYQNNIIFTF